MKITLLLDKENVVYAYSKCHEIKNEETNEIQFIPSLILNDEARNLGCKMVIIDESQIPLDIEMGYCFFDFDETDLTKKLKLSQAKLDWMETENIRAERKIEFDVGDKYQLPYLKALLTEDQLNEYETWRSAWLKAPETKIKPTRPSWLV